MSISSSQLFVGCAALIASAINAAAGGGSFISFPALLAVGIAPVQANATNNLAMWLGSSMSAGGLRSDLDISRSTLFKFLAVSLVGSIGGALILLHTSNKIFVSLLPFLLLGATLLYTLGPQITRATNSLALALPDSPPALAAQFAVAVYGGFFGAAQGIMMLALFGLFGMHDARKANALKNIMAMAINGFACLPYVLAHLIDWPTGIAMSIGAMSGGTVGAQLVKRLPSNITRGIVSAIASSMTLYFFWKVYVARI